MLDLKQHIRTIPDFPKPGILFYDITTLIHNGPVFHETVRLLAEKVSAWGKIDLIAAPEARGFIFAAPLANELSVGLIPIRKPGKLPFKTVSITYELEYGSDTVQMNIDAIQPGDRVLLIDDLLATGGTMDACRQLVEQNGAEVVGAAFVMELLSLNGREKLQTKNIQTLVAYE